MVVLAGAEPRETSLLSEQPGKPVGDCYHRTCFDEARGPHGPPD
jgi:hypothetical protein